MTPLEFHDAMRPRLEARACTFVHTQLSFSQQKALMMHFRQLMTAAFYLEKNTVELMPRLMRLQTKQPSVSKLIADMVDVFFMTTKCFHTIDSTGSLTLRVNAYEARLKHYLATLAGTLLDHHAITKGKRMLHKSKNDEAFAMPKPGTAQVVVNGILIRI